LPLLNRENTLEKDIMEQVEFLEKKIFTDLMNVNDGFDDKSIVYFSEKDFETLLERVEYNGIGLYEIKTWFDGKVYSEDNHETYRKKATDPNWYKKTFKTLRHKQEGLLYCASYKVSAKLLARN
jgi:hypothetical protein